ARPAAAAPARAAAGGHRARPPAAPRRPGGRLRRGLAAARAGAQVPERGARSRLAVRVLLAAALDRSTLGDAAPAPCRRQRAATRRAGGEETGGDRQAGHLPYAAPFVRHPPA